MAGEVPAVYRGNIQRKQRLQSLRVIPVVEMAAVPFHRLHGLERLRGPLDQFAGGDVSEIVRR